MSAFGDLARRFPGRLMELCLDECFAEQRPVFYVDELDEFDDPCYFCHRQRLFTDFSYKNPYPGNPAIPSNIRHATCGGEECERFWMFFSGKDGRVREKQFRLLWKRQPWDMEPEIRSEAILTFMLNHEAKNGRLSQSATNPA